MEIREVAPAKLIPDSMRDEIVTRMLAEMALPSRFLQPRRRNAYFNAREICGLPVVTDPDVPLDEVRLVSERMTVRMTHVRT